MGGALRTSPEHRDKGGGGRIAMRKTRHSWILTVTVLAVVLVVMSAGCARGRWRPPWAREKAVTTPTYTPPPRRAPTVQPPAPIETTPLTQEVEVRGKVFEPATDLEMIYFEFDKSRITEEARVVLQDDAEIIKQNQDVIVQIEGHCDERGTSEYNLALGLRRARSTRDYLINLGVDAGRLVTISYGEEQPLDPRHNEEAWAKNRRAQFNRAQ
jgi:peptidoglycan-associated lipoprotein